ncbi:MAG: adenylyl-sulfate reductase [gamma proteobacterium symbiont of Bathyaustriella thionipta]|nr:adenylyl-sulfate reductase [gamma proteobacterium symbiont of Bathyaustriella thionipta]MCU7948999.1 adenylyl-sulfate reductase [gamma proteobacterium symbiont of Bathyaustriella thionipta]MCU7953463.1 adenylyl-sulfate reductase [gamma proteobacterium symbiont of Bathyaustriella thionipta]MCU7955563.1 adenylyl-sulfate reductase [gamma proteobacterium symbiont of Bathyaustriella thionipta]MCU7967344.1 adenylyl-sulfate reductase [gamma proteobacterium symbiont of Bathyaustriella thionipta]
MLSTNPFADLATTISPEIMQGYLILMVLLVVVGTMIDVIHKKSAEYFFENSKKQQKNARRTVTSGEKTSAAIGVVLNEVLTSGEFENPQRRLSHLLTMYGFIIFVISTITLIFAYPTSADAGIWGTLWHLGAASLAVGGYWFWFIIRVDVSAEGHKWYQLAKADLFIVSALMMVTWGLIWSIAGGGLSGLNLLFFVLFIISSTSLFSTVLWSKFAHMFFKPAAAYQKRMTKLDGSQENLPDVGEMNDPAIHAKFPDIPEYMGKNPPNMGLGIKSEPPHHY